MIDCVKVINYLNSIFEYTGSFGSYYSARSGSSVGGSVVSSEHGHSEQASVHQTSEMSYRLYLLNELFFPALLEKYVSDR